MKTYPFHKAQRLCGQQRIKRLYAEGLRMTVFPLRVSYQTNDRPTMTSPVRVLIWAPKSLFKHAVDRNRIKRQMREAYRLSANPLIQLCQNQNIHIDIAVNYMTKQQLPYSQIAAAMRKIIQRLCQPFTGGNTDTATTLSDNHAATTIS